MEDVQSMVSIPGRLQGLFTHDVARMLCLSPFLRESL